jgi:hypothetical protein
MDSAALYWALVPAIVGGAGGALNAVMTDDLRVLPSYLKTLAFGTSTTILRPGLVGNVILGAVAAVLIVWGLSESAARETWSFRLLGASAFSGFVTARWASGEADKQLLRCAVSRACVAPAAHPEVVRAIAAARPFKVYTLAEQLMPRHSVRR